MQLHVKSQDLKNPKALEALIAVVARLAVEFGIMACDHHALIELASEWITNPLAPVRKQATAVLTEVYKQSGGVLKDTIMLTLKPAQATAVQAEFDSVTEDAMTAARSTPPARTVKGTL